MLPSLVRRPATREPGVIRVCASPYRLMNPVGSSDFEQSAGVGQWQAAPSPGERSRFDSAFPHGRSVDRGSFDVIPYLPAKGASAVTDSRPLKYRRLQAAATYVLVRVL